MAHHIPYSEAAPESDHVYNVGGSFTYVLNGDIFNCRRVVHKFPLQARDHVPSCNCCCVWSKVSKHNCHRWTIMLSPPTLAPMTMKLSSNPFLLAVISGKLSSCLFYQHQLLSDQIPLYLFITSGKGV